MARKKKSREERRSGAQINQQGYQPYQPYQPMDGQPNYQGGNDPYYQQPMNGQPNYQGNSDPYYQQPMNGQPNYQGGSDSYYQQPMNGQPNYQGNSDSYYQQPMGGQPNYQGGGDPYYQQPMNGQPYQQQYSRNTGYQQPGSEAQAEALRKKKKRRTRKIVMFVVEVIVLVILAGALYIAAAFSKMETVELENEEEIKQQVVEQLDEEVVEQLNDYWNIALYGVDSRSGETSMQTRTDTIMVASIDRATKEVKLVSVYRDTYLDNTDGHYRKATECYEAGGASRSINMLNRNLDLDITNYVSVDMSVVAEVVDMVGGVEIDVRDDEITHLNNYQVEGSEITGKEIIPVTETGPQVLNGLQAMSYCRIRYTDGADYERTERQRTVLGKIFEKVQKLDILTLTGMIDQILPYITTNLTKTEILSLAKDVAAYKIGETAGFPFNKTAMGSDWGDIVVPVDLQSNVTELHEFLFGTQNYVPSSQVQEISAYISNYTGYYAE